jgi:hypothetical protein
MLIFTSIDRGKSKKKRQEAFTSLKTQDTEQVTILWNWIMEQSAKQKMIIKLKNSNFTNHYLITFPKLKRF